jgi:hypothetical protein
VVRFGVVRLWWFDMVPAGMRVIGMVRA